MPKPQKLTLYDGYAVLNRITTTIQATAYAEHYLAPVQMELCMRTDQMPIAIADWAMGAGVHITITVTESKIDD